MSRKTEIIIFPNSSAPSVINHDLLVKLVIDQGPKGEAGKLFAEDDIKLNEVKEIRIEYLNILKISHLWIMSNLVILKLSSNVIEKIENLDELVNLKELDLSFNRIKIMDNLNHLVNLEILLLYCNKIEVVEGIDSLEMLQIMSLGRNEIKCRNHVMYLRKFDNLKSLNMEGNPCTKDEEYLDYLIAYIPQLVYLEYKMITEDQRRRSVDKHFRDISNLKEKEDEEKEALIAKKAYEDHITQVSICYVEYLDDDYLFEQMFKNDKEGKALMNINRETEAIHEQYKITFLSFCHELFDCGLKEQKRRVDEIDLFEKTVENGKDDAQEEAQQLIEEILENKLTIFSQITELMKNLGEENSNEFKKNISKVKVISEEFDDLLHRIWKKLMSREIILHEQLEDLNEIFKINMTDLVGSFVETAQGFFTMMRNAEREYNDNMKSLVTLFMNSFGDEIMPLEYQEICGSKDIMINNFGASHDLHLQVIDDREDILVNRLKKWLDELTEKQSEEEKKRHRDQILEITHFFDFQREEFHKLQRRQERLLNYEDDDEEKSDKADDTKKSISDGTKEVIKQDSFHEYTPDDDVEEYASENDSEENVDKNSVYELNISQSVNEWSILDH